MTTMKTAVVVVATTMMSWQRWFFCIYIAVCSFCSNSSGRFSGYTNGGMVVVQAFVINSPLPSSPTSRRSLLSSRRRNSIPVDVAGAVVGRTRRRRSIGRTRRDTGFMGAATTVLQSTTTSATTTTATTATATAASRSLVSSSTTLLSISVIMAVVIIHELGHYVTAKIFNITIKDFSIGVGPKLLQFHALNNTFTLRAIPIGGYVEFEGNNSDDDIIRASKNDDKSEEDDKDAIIITTDDEKYWLQNRPWYERAIVLSGGVLFNMILSYVLFLGIFIRNGSMKHYGITVLQCMKVTWNFLRYLANATAMGAYSLIGNAVRKAFAGAGAGAGASAATSGAQISGPIGIIKEGSTMLAGAAASASTTTASSSAAEAAATASTEAPTTSLLIAMMYFGAMISLNLGVMNSLPIPPLDGGKLLFVLFEGVCVSAILPLCRRFGRRNRHPRQHQQRQLHQEQLLQVKVKERIESIERFITQITTWGILFLVFRTTWKDIIRK